LDNEDEDWDPDDEDPDSEMVAESQLSQVAEDSDADIEEDGEDGDEEDEDMASGPEDSDSDSNDEILNGAQNIHALGMASMISYLQNLTPAQRASLTPLLNNGLQQAVQTQWAPLNPTPLNPTSQPSASVLTHPTATQSLSNSSLSPGLQNLSSQNPTTTGPSSPYLHPPPGPSIRRPQLPNRINISSTIALANLTRLGTPVPPTPHGIPIMIYYPAIIAGPTENTDALILGYIQPGDTEIVLTRAIFLRVDIHTSLLRRVQRGGWRVLESYACPMASTSNSSSKSAQAHALSKLRTAWHLMASTQDRERDVTKRWRVTPGPMTTEKGSRGAVWEGWAFTLDRIIGLSGEEREGAVVQVEVGGEVDVGELVRRREMDALIDGEED
jgi:hypothetical protein